ADSAVIEVDAFRSELRAVRGTPEPEHSRYEQPEVMQPEPAKPITLAEVQAQLHAEEVPAAPLAAQATTVEAVAQSAETPMSDIWTSQPAAETAAPVETWGKPEQEGYDAELESALANLSVEQASAPAADAPATEVPVAEMGAPAAARSDSGSL